MKILIVDDEFSGREILKKLLETRHSNYVDEIRMAGSVEEAFETLQDYLPHLVFLDVQMHGKTGFDLLERLGNFTFDVIFVSAHDQFAIDAFRVNALDYLLKPVDTVAFDEAVNKAVQKNKETPLAFQPQFSNDKIGLTTRDGFVIINVNDIIRCEADSNYTNFILDKNQRIVVSRTLKEAGKILEKFPAFLRVQRSYIVNMNKITKYSKSDGGYVVLTDSFQVTVSPEARTAIERLFSVL